MIDKKKLMQIAEELFIDRATDIGEDVEAMGVDSDAVFEFMAHTVNKAKFEMAMTRSVDSNLFTLFMIGFGLGYKCALENEMQRMLDK